MKTSLQLLTLPLLALAAITMLTLSGCETHSPDEMSVKVTPDYAKLAPGQSITLTASGWHAYNWKLKDSEIGYLSSTVGKKVTYRATKGSSTGYKPSTPSVVETPYTEEGTNTYTKVTTTSYVDKDTHWEITTVVTYKPVGTTKGQPKKAEKSETTTTEEKGAQLKQVITVQATGAGSGTNSTSIAAGEAIILQEG